MRCHPMCSQRVHYSVSVAFAGFSSCGSLAVLGVPSLSPPPLKKKLIIFFPLSHLARVWRVPEGSLARGARGLVAGWAGQSGVLVPWGCDCGCSPRVSWAPTLHSDLGVNGLLTVMEWCGFEAWLGTFFCILGQVTFLTDYLFSPSCVSGLNHEGILFIPSQETENYS